MKFLSVLSILFLLFLARTIPALEADDEDVEIAADPTPTPVAAPWSPLMELDDKNFDETVASAEYILVEL
jgi:hypothetical protein